MMTRKNNSRHFLFALPIFFIFIFLFFSKSSLAATIQCEYIPKDSSQRILYFEGTDADHRPWTREMEDSECLMRCSSEAAIGLKFQCAVSGGIFGGLIAQNPEGCDATYTTCGEVNSPTLTIKCKFTPRRSDDSALDGAWETLTTSESECQSLCDGAAGRGLCSSWCGTIGSALCCDEAQTTCEKTTNIPPAPATHQFESITPELETPLPTLSGFMDVVLQGEAPNRYILIPWLGQYIAAIYKYAIGIVGILSGIMIVIGGLLWLTAGGAADRVSTAKSFIESSLVGLVIALTSYLLLYAINPKLTEFDSLKIKYLERVTLEMGLNNNLVDTTAASETAASEGARSIATSQQCDETLASCSLTFTSPLDSGTGPGNPRALEFMEKMESAAPYLVGTTRFKVVAVATAAANCCVVLGSCGESNLRINKLAGVYEAVAGQRRVFPEELKNGLGTSTRGIATHELPSPQQNYLDTINCESGSPRGCHSAAVQTAYETLKSEVGGGYPDSWADELQPGDSIVIFNANSSVRGAHAAIFMGWSARNGVANVVQGSPGKVVKRGTLCLKSTCGTPFPLIKTFKPQP